MPSYSVAEAKSGLPALINRAIAGEEVIITRHGRPVAELRPSTPSPPTGDRAAAFARLMAARIVLPPGAPTAVELLSQIYEEPGS